MIVRGCFFFRFKILMPILPKGMSMIDKFNTNPDVYIFLISTLAGGTGLNLTGKRILPCS